MNSNSRVAADSVVEAENSLSMDLLVAFLGLSVREKPGTAVLRFRTQPGQSCSVLRLVHKRLMLNIHKRFVEPVGAHKGPLKDARMLVKIPSFGGHYMCASLDKLLLAHLVVVPAASVASLF